MRFRTRLISFLLMILMIVTASSGSAYAAETSADGQAAENKEENMYTIILDANGGYFDHEWDDILEEFVDGKDIVNKVIKQGDSVNLVPLMDNDGIEAVFLGWSYDRNGDTPLANKERFVPEESGTLYALWEIKESDPEESGNSAEEIISDEENNLNDVSDTEATTAEESSTVDTTITEISTTAETSGTSTTIAETASAEETGEAATTITETTKAEESGEAATTLTEAAEVEEPDTASTEMTEVASPEEPNDDISELEEEVSDTVGNEAKHAVNGDFILTIYACKGGMTYSWDGGAENHGHTWLSIKNNTNTPYDFYGYKINPGCSMDLGLFGDQSLSPYGLGGVFINRESWVMREKQVSCYSTGVSIDAINRIKAATPAESYYHDGSSAGTGNIHDNLWHNCTTFAVKMWNLAVGTDEEFDIDFVDVPYNYEEKIDERNLAVYKHTVHTDKYNNSTVGLGDVFHVDKKGSLIPAYSLVLSPDKTAVKAGQSVKIAARFLNTELYDNAVVWKSSDLSIATVDEGTVTGVKGGTCTITASLGEYLSADCEVTVVSGAIYTVDDLKAVSFDRSGTYVLMNDIDLQNTEWVPIGTPSFPFTGKLNGNGHSIYGLKVSGSSDYRGLFGKIENAEITRLSVHGTVSGHEYVGGIAGLADNSSLSYCINYASVTGTDQVGGVIGRCYKTKMDYCMNSGNVSASGRACGGITADIYPSGSVTNSLNLTTVSGGNDLTGGITGGSTSGTVSYCINAAQVNYSGGRAGAIAGDNNSYSGSRTGNYFLKTKSINAGFSVIGSGGGTFSSANDNMVIDLKNKILNGIGGNKQNWPITLSVFSDKIVAGQKVTLSVGGCDWGLSYKTSDSSVAVVDKGIVNTKKAGRVEITVTAPETAYYNSTSRSIMIYVLPKAPAKVSAVNQAAGVKLTWTKVSDAAYYEIYRDGKKIKTIKKNSTVTYVDKYVKNRQGKKVYEVCACTADGRTGRRCTIYRLRRPTILRTQNMSRVIFIASREEPYAEGIQIQGASNRTFKPIAFEIQVKNCKRLYGGITNLNAGKKYYIRIRTYKTVNGKRYYSAWSNLKSGRAGY